jgi:hypothetical protein
MGDAVKIKKIKGYALGDGDIRKILGDDINIISYPQLANMRSVEEAFDDKGRSIILFPNVSPTMGHWCCMINHGDSIEFFDPYGEPPEAQKKGLGRSRLEALDIDRPLLTKLLRESGMPVFYNAKDFQSERSDVATCGRHCAVRLLFADRPLSKYNAVIKKSGLTPDEFVSGVTYGTIKK